MPRIDYAKPGEEAKGATPVYEQIKEGFGMVPNLVQLVGHSGPVAQVLGTILDTYFNQLALDPRLREIAYLTVARHNECPYCTGHHTMFAKQAGLSDEEISLLGDAGMSSDKFSGAEKSIIKYALETTKNVKAELGTIEGLKKYFSLEQIVEIAFAVSAGNFIQRIGKNFEAELEM